MATYDENHAMMNRREAELQADDMTDYEDESGSDYEDEEESGSDYDDENGFDGDDGLLDPLADDDEAHDELLESTDEPYLLNPTDDDPNTRVRVSAADILLCRPQVADRDVTKIDCDCKKQEVIDDNGQELKMAYRKNLQARLNIENLFNSTKVNIERLLVDSEDDKKWVVIADILRKEMKLKSQIFTLEDTLDLVTSVWNVWNKKRVTPKVAFSQMDMKEVQAKIDINRRLLKDDDHGISYNADIKTRHIFAQAAGGFLLESYNCDYSDRSVEALRKLASLMDIQLTPFEVMLQSEQFSLDLHLKNPLSLGITLSERINLAETNIELLTKRKGELEKLLEELEGECSVFQGDPPSILQTDYSPKEQARFNCMRTIKNEHFESKEGVTPEVQKKYQIDRQYLVYNLIEMLTEEKSREDLRRILEIERDKSSRMNAIMDKYSEIDRKAKVLEGRVKDRINNIDSNHVSKSSKEKYAIYLTSKIRPILEARPPRNREKYPDTHMSYVQNHYEANLKELITVRETYKELDDNNTTMVDSLIRRMYILYDELNSHGKFDKTISEEEAKLKYYDTQIENCHFVTDSEIILKFPEDLKASYIPPGFGLGKRLKDQECSFVREKIRRQDEKVSKKKDGPSLKDLKYLDSEHEQLDHLLRDSRAEMNLLQETARLQNDYLSAKSQNEEEKDLLIKNLQEKVQVITKQQIDLIVNNSKGGDNETMIDVLKKDLANAKADYENTIKEKDAVLEETRLRLEAHRKASHDVDHQKELLNKSNRLLFLRDEEIASLKIQLSKTENPVKEQNLQSRIAKLIEERTRITNDQESVKEYYIDQINVLKHEKDVKEREQNTLANRVEELNQDRSGILADLNAAQSELKDSVSKQAKLEDDLAAMTTELEKMLRRVAASTDKDETTRLRQTQDIAQLEIELNRKKDKIDDLSNETKKLILDIETLAENGHEQELSIKEVERQRDRAFNEITSYKDQLDAKTRECANMSEEIYRRNIENEVANVEKEEKKKEREELRQKADELTDELMEARTELISITDKQKLKARQDADTILQDMHELEQLRNAADMEHHRLISEKAEALEKLEEENTLLRARLPPDQEKTHERLRENMNKLIEENQRLQNVNTDISDKNREFEKDTRARKREVARLKFKIAADLRVADFNHASSQGVVREKFDDMIKQNLDQKNEYEAKLAQVENEKAVEISKIVTMEKQIDSLRESTDAQTEVVANLQSTVLNLREAVNNKETRQLELEERIKNLVRDAEINKQNLVEKDENEAELARLKNDKAVDVNKISTLEKQLDSLRKNTDAQTEVVANIADLESTLLDLRETMKSRDSIQLRLEERNKNLVRDADIDKQNLLEKEAELVRLKNEKAVDVSKIVTVEKQLENLRKETEAKAMVHIANIADFKSTVRGLRNVVKNQEIEGNKLKEKIKEITDDAEIDKQIMDASNKDLKIITEKLQKTVESLQQQLGEADLRVKTLNREANEKRHEFDAYKTTLQAAEMNVIEKQNMLLSGEQKFRAWEMDYAQRSEILTRTNQAIKDDLIHQRENLTRQFNEQSAALTLKEEDFKIAQAQYVQNNAEKERIITEQTEQIKIYKTNDLKYAENVRLLGIECVNAQLEYQTNLKEKTNIIRIGNAQLKGVNDTLNQVRIDLAETEKELLYVEKTRENEIFKSTEQIKSMAEELVLKRSKIETLEAELVKEQANSEELEQSIEKNDILLKEKTAFAQEVEALKTSLTHQQQQNSIKTTDVQRYLNEINVGRQLITNILKISDSTKLVNRHTTLAKLIQKLDEQNRASETELSNQIKAENVRLQQKEENITRLEDQIAKQQVQINNSKETLLQKEEMIIKLSESLNEATKHIDDQQQTTKELAVMQEKLLVVEKSHGNITNELGSTKERLLMVEQELRDCNDQLNNSKWTLRDRLRSDTRKRQRS